MSSVQFPVPVDEQGGIVSQDQEAHEHAMELVSIVVAVRKEVSPPWAFGPARVVIESELYSGLGGAVGQTQAKQLEEYVKQHAELLEWDIFQTIHEFGWNSYSFQIGRSVSNEKICPITLMDLAASFFVGLITGGVIVLLITAFRNARMDRRRFQKKCMHCGYPSVGGVCPECGAETEAERAKTDPS